MSRIRRHWLVLVIALVVGTVYVSHHFFISRILAREGRSYEPVTIAGNRDEGVFYGARVRAVFNGQLIAGDISVAGRESSPSLLPMLNPLLLGGIARIAGSPERAFILSDFLFPALIFLALYFLAHELTGRKPLDILFASVFTFIPKLFLTIPPVLPGMFRDFASALLPDSQDLPYFSRFEYPKVTFLFFALAFFFTFRVLKRNAKHAVFPAGVAFGALFYTYLYDWVYFFIGLVLVSALFLFQKDYQKVRHLLAVIGIGLLVSAPYWINFVRLASLPQYGDLANRIGSELGRSVRLASAWKTYLRSASLVFLIWFLWKKRDRIGAYFLLGFLPVIAIVVNLQVVLGFNPQPDHWHRVQFLTIGLGFLMLGRWFYERYIRTGSRERRFRIAAGLLIILVFGSGLFSEYAFSAAQANRFTVPEDRAASYAWLAEHTPKGSVIASLGIANSELPLYAGSKLFLPNGFNTTVSDSEIWDRFMVTARLFGVSSGEFASLLAKTDVALYLFHDKYRDRSFDSYFRTSGHELPAPEREATAARYVEYRREPLSELLTKHRLNYVYWRVGDPGSDPVLALPALAPVYRAGDVTIYEFHP